MATRGKTELRLIISTQVRNGGVSVNFNFCIRLCAPSA